MRCLPFLKAPILIERRCAECRPLIAPASCFSLASGRREYTDPGEKFENVTAVCYRPISDEYPEPSILRMINCTKLEEIDEERYFELLRTIYNERNPHAPIGDDFPPIVDE